MINQFFFISDTAFQTGENLPGADNIFFSILVNPAESERLQNVYEFMENTRPSQFGLTLDIVEQLAAENIQFITSFLFLPSYLKIGQDPIINLSGTSQELLGKTGSALSAYLASQGFNNVTINQLVTTTQSEAKSCCLFTSPEELLKYYKEILQNGQYYNNSIFYYVSSMETFYSTLSSLQQVENEFKQDHSKLYALINKNRILEKEISELRRKMAYIETELSYQKHHNDILRSDHSTKELQKYYDHEYEILPAWYKRFGHILKVITGKRTFRSLFRDDVKKYKN